MILGMSHDYDLCNALPYGTDYIIRDIIIEDNVWIGMQVIVTPGARIGEGAVVGMGSIVTGEIPACAVAVGNPARVVKYRDIDRYKRLVAEHKFLNRIRRKAPKHKRHVRNNKKKFDALIANRGFLLSFEIEGVDQAWSSAILYELAMGTAAVLFGNADRFHLAIRADLLKQPSVCCHDIAQLIEVADMVNHGVDYEALSSDIDFLAENLANEDIHIRRDKLHGN